MNYEEYAVRVYPDGDKSWYQNGHKHRLDGPAVEFANGDKSWFQNGRLHRLDGPAVEYANDAKYWWIEGVNYTKEEFDKKIQEMNNPTKEMTVEQIAKELGYKVKVIEG